MNQAITQSLLEHLQVGGSTDKDVVAQICDVTPRSIKTMEKYLAACAEEDDLLEGVALGEPTAYYDDDPVEDDEEGTPDSNNSGELGEEGEPGVPEEDEDEDEDEESDDESDDSEEEEPEPEQEQPKSKKPAKKNYRFFLEHEDGTSMELERIASKSAGAVVTFREKSIKDIVTLIIKGETVEVDIIPLRKAKPSATSEYGISNELLLNLALAAR